MQTKNFRVIPCGSNSQLKNVLRLVNFSKTFQAGIFGEQAFTHGDRCRIANKLLPRMKVGSVQHGNKMFCGIYSKDGQQFLTASQGRPNNLSVYIQSFVSNQLVS